MAKQLDPQDDPQSGFLEGPGGQIKPVSKADQDIPKNRDRLDTAEWK